MSFAETSSKIGKVDVGGRIGEEVTPKHPPARLSETVAIFPPEQSRCQVLLPPEYPRPNANTKKTERGSA